MTSEPLRWPEIRALFDACAECPPAEWEARIAASGLTGAEVAELRSLLDHLTRDPAAPDPLAGVAATRLLGPETLPPGYRLGAWAIVRPLGSGGMGEVYEARRADGQYDGRAAIKRLKRGMDSAAVLRRFEHERQALARLSHPNIARLLDAGADAQGLPYFVMEHVDGRHLDDAARDLPLRERLSLFLQLADAVAHAHRHLLVHRDLKPGNVLVDSDGQVKLLDFGIAKALDPDDEGGAQRGEVTHAGGRPYTPNYASPEQVRGDPVSTATDLYSLGVLLYQMLTGTRPTGRQAETPAQAARSVLEDTPTPPSRLSATDTPDPDWLQTRRKLEGDLDNILLKALEKDIDQRYPSVEALARDIRAHLDGRPVSAHAPSPTYLLGKFVRRHRASTALACGLVLALLAGLASTTWQWRQAEQARLAERQRAAQVRAQANRLLFEYHDELLLLPGATPVVARLLADARSYLSSLRESTPADATLLRELGVSFRRLGELHHSQGRPALGDVQASLALLREATSLLTQARSLAPASAETRYQLALAQAAQGATLQELADIPAALAQLEPSAALFDGLVAETPSSKPYRVEQVRSRLRLRDALGSSPAKADAELQRAADLLAPLLRDMPADADVLALFATTQNTRYLGAARDARFEEGLTLLRSLDPVFDRLVAGAPDNALHARDAAVNKLSQGIALGQLGRYTEALAASSDALRRMQAVSDKAPANATARRDVAKLQTDVGWAHLKLGSAAAALAPLQASVEGFEALAQRDAADRRVAAGLALAHATLAEAQGALGQADALTRHSERATRVAQGLAASGAIDGRRAVAMVGQQLGTAWRGLSRASGDTADRRACQNLETSLQAWQQLDTAGAVRPMDRPRLAITRQAAQSCRP
jgi:serine/threonine protein kinase/tetratricopeptide (TPR) repeat protein